MRGVTSHSADDALLISSGLKGHSFPDSELVVTNRKRVFAITTQIKAWQNAKAAVIIIVIY